MRLIERNRDIAVNNSITPDQQVLEHSTNESALENQPIVLDQQDSPAPLFDPLNLPDFPSFTSHHEESLFEPDLPTSTTPPAGTISNSDMILAFSSRHKLSDAAVTDLLSMLRVMEVPGIPRKASDLFSCPDSKTFFFCDCHEYRETNFDCNKCKKSKNFFLVPNFIESCKKIICPQFPSGSTINASLYTDGVSTFQSSKFSIWPIYLVINNLDFSVRYNLKNIIVCGIWYGKVKPDMQKLIKIFLNPLIPFFNNGFAIGSFNFSINIQFLIADKPARSMLLNTQSSNAKFFCPCCTATNITETVGGSRCTHFCLNDSLNWEVRTKEWFSACAYSAESTGNPEYGIKGFSFLQNIVNFNIIDSNIFDYMHSVALGIFKSLNNLLFFTARSENSFRDKIKDYDLKSKSIKFPSSIVKCPPLLSDHGIWQAKDYRNFYLFSFPILTQQENNRTTKCVMTLRAGLILILHRPSEEDCSAAKNHFDFFLSEFKELFGEQHLTPNFHDLHHLPDMARKCGSLVEFSGFNFEHINGCLARMCHGNKRFDIQISRKLNSLFGVSDLPQNDFSPKNTFLYNLLSKRRWKTTLKINEAVQVCGKLSAIQDIESFSHSLRTAHGASINFSSARLIVNNKKISIDSYSTKKSFNNSFFISLDKTYCLILQKFIVERGPNSLACFIIADKSSILVLDKHFFQITGSTEKVLINPEDLFFMHSPGIKFEDKVVAIPKLEYF